MLLTDTDWTGHASLPAALAPDLVRDGYGRREVTIATLLADETLHGMEARIVVRGLWWRILSVYDDRSGLRAPLLYAADRETHVVVRARAEAIATLNGEDWTHLIGTDETIAYPRAACATIRPPR
jgi:hypothetical protein